MSTRVHMRRPLSRFLGQHFGEFDQVAERVSEESELAAYGRFVPDVGSDDVQVLSYPSGKNVMNKAGHAICRSIQRR